MTNDDNRTKEQQLEELKERRQKLQMMGGSDRIAAQNKRGKLTARQRIDMLLDEGSFQETGMFVKSRGASSYGEVPADAVVTGYGKIDGRRVYIYAQDFTSMGGTMSEMQGQKICELMDSAMKAGCPVIALNDSGGARIQDGVDSLSGYGQLFRRNTLASGVVPQICAILGPTAGGKTEAALFPLLSRMLSEDWRGLSTLYVCPLKALLNNLEPRLRAFADLLGRRVGIWHGDVGPADAGGRGPGDRVRQEGGRATLRLLRVPDRRMDHLEQRIE